MIFAEPSLPLRSSMYRGDVFVEAQLYEIFISHQGTYWMYIESINVHRMAYKFRSVLLYYILESRG